jgi:membrane-associated phospholipid phosphatase
MSGEHLVILFIVWALGAAIIALIGLLAYASDWQLNWFRPVAWSHRLASRIGAIRATAIIVLAGAVFTFVACLPLGLLAKQLEPAVDRPVFQWIYPRAHHAAFTSANELLTKMGNHSQVRVVCVVAALALAVAWRRRFFVPVIVIATAFFLEKLGQSLLARIVDRGHPPTTLGTFPSGGCAKVVSLYGVIIFLVLASAPTLARRWRILMWTMLALAAWVEAFSRVYLSKHWLTDAVAGLVYGTFLLLVMVAATAAFTQYRPAGAGPRAPDRRITATHPAGTNN